MALFQKTLLLEANWVERRSVWVSVQRCPQAVCHLFFARSNSDCHCHGAPAGNNAARGCVLPRASAARSSPTNPELKPSSFIYLVISFVFPPVGIQTSCMIWKLSLLVLDLFFFPLPTGKKKELILWCRMRLGWWCVSSLYFAHGCLSVHIQAAVLKWWWRSHAIYKDRF